MAGRPRKVIDISTRKVAKAERKERAAQEKKIKLERDQLRAPAWLDSKAKKEFKRVVTEAASIDLWDNLDLGILAIYANAYSRFTEAAQYIEEHGDIGERQSAYGAYETVSPYTAVVEKYSKIILQCSTKLGLATTDRLKLIVPVKQEKEVNKYLKYMKQEDG